jgi:hypothetical protein
MASVQPHLSHLNSMATDLTQKGEAPYGNFPFSLLSLPEGYKSGFCAIHPRLET